MYPSVFSSRSSSHMLGWRALNHSGRKGDNFTCIIVILFYFSAISSKILVTAVPWFGLLALMTIMAYRVRRESIPYWGPYLSASTLISQQLWLLLHQPFNERLPYPPPTNVSFSTDFSHNISKLADAAICGLKSQSQIFFVYVWRLRNKGVSRARPPYLTPRCSQFAGRSKHIW